MLLNEFFDYKNEIMKTFCSNKDIVRLVTDSSEAPVPNYDLIYSQIFPYEYVPETVDDGQTFICFDVDIADVVSKTYLVPVVYVWVFTHKSKLRLAEGGLRLDSLATAIGNELNGNRNIGLGELELSSVGRFVPIDDYQGRVLTFYSTDFNRARPSRRPPTNRKHYE